MVLASVLNFPFHTNLVYFYKSSVVSGVAALTDRCATQAAVGGVCLASPFFVISLDLVTLGVLFEDFNAFLMDYTTKVWIAVW